MILFPGKMPRRLHLCIPAIGFLIILVTFTAGAADFPQAKLIRKRPSTAEISPASPAAKPRDPLLPFRQEVRTLHPEWADFFDWLATPGASRAEIAAKATPAGLAPSLTRLLFGLKYLAEGWPDAALARAGSLKRGEYGYDGGRILAALARAARNEWPDCRQAAQDASSLARNDPTAHWLLARAALALGTENEPRRHLRQAVPLYAADLQTTLAKLPKNSEAPSQTPARPGQDRFALRKIPRAEPFPSSGPLLRIGLSTSGGTSLPRREIRFRCAAAGILDPGRRALTAGNCYRLRRSGHGEFLLDDAALGEGEILRLHCPEGVLMLEGIEFGRGFSWAGREDRVYRGTIEFRAAGDGFILINELSLEEYLAGVLPAELPAHSPTEALKAQAVAARSESLAKRRWKRHQAENYDLCDDVHCQAYRGVSWESAATNRALSETKGLALLDSRGRILDAVYGSCCGGRTQSSGDLAAWGQFAHLSGRPDGGHGGGLAFLGEGADDWCAHARLQHRWVRIVRLADWRRAMAETLDLRSLDSVIPLRRNPSGHLRKLRFAGQGKERDIEKELKLRATLLPGAMLRSAALLPLVVAGRGDAWLVLAGAGFGHGVGLCQEGAVGQGRAGKKFDEILKFYYSGAKIGTTDDN